MAYDTLRFKARLLAHSHSNPLKIGHSIAVPQDPRITNEHPELQNVSLENFCDKQYGFLRFDAIRSEEDVSLVGSYYTLPGPQLAVGEHNAEPKLFDQFIVKTSRLGYSMQTTYR